MEKEKIIYDTFISLKETMQLKNEKLVSISIDGAYLCVGSENEFVTLLKNDFPNLIGTHYITHCEALAASICFKEDTKILVC
jgi:hypothetical protein